MSGSSQLVASLRALLRERGTTYRALALQLGISEATVKRDFSRGTFSLQRLDRICEALDVSLEELVLGRYAQTTALTQLSDAQERALVREPLLLVLTYLVVNDWKLDEIGATFAFDEAALVRALLRLDTLRIIDFRPPRRIKKLTARNFSWRRDGPVHKFFVDRVAPEFLGGRFDGAADQLQFLGGLLSPAAAVRIRASIARVIEEFEHAARRDTRLGLESTAGYSVLLALRQWEFSAFTRLRRGGPAKAAQKR